MLKLIHMLHGVVVSDIEINEGELTIGRNTDCGLQIEDPRVSGTHACLKIQKNEYMPDMLDVIVEDLGSTNGTYINNLKVTTHKVHNGDIIKFGTHEFKLVDDEHNEMTQTEYYIPDDN
ncbi:MAG: FHA domain-containing protein [Gammaproteobacteria bacterium]|nr:FHA domain-containing protein [Gammaproteobacteria bacterium]